MELATLLMAATVTVEQVDECSMYTPSGQFDSLDVAEEPRGCRRLPLHHLGQQRRLRRG